MAKVINPFGSVSAHGRIGGLVFQTGRWGQIVKGHVPQRGAPTKKQYNQNYLFGLAADDWRFLTDEEQEEWNIKARGKRMTGFNLYIKENIFHPENVTYGKARYGIGKYV